MNASAQDTSLLAVAFSSMLAGIFFPRIGAWFSPYPFYLLMVLLLLSFLTISLGSIARELRRSAGLVGSLVGCKLILLPLGMFFLFRHFLPSHALAALLITGISTAVVAPFFAGLLAANSSVVLSTVVLTSLLAPLTLPALVKVLAGQTLKISFPAMAEMLGAMVFVPFTLSEILKRWATRVVNLLLPRRFPISLLVFAVMNLGVYSRYPEYFRSNFDALALALGVVLLLAALYVGAGFLVSLKLAPADRLAAVLSLALINNMTVLVLSIRFFGAREFTVAAVYTVPFFGIVVPLRRFRT
jgi:BASS family bile acid:Na+ symporter